jgi:hypothetical protein
MREVCILADAHHRKAYRLRFEKSVSLSTLVRANAGREYRVHRAYDRPVPMWNSTRLWKARSTHSIHPLCRCTLTYFGWASYKRQTIGIKLHTLYNVKPYIPDFIIVAPYEILQILARSLLDKTPVSELLTKNDYKNVKEPACNLLLFN